MPLNPLSGIVRNFGDIYNLKNPTLFIFAENDVAIPLEHVSGASLLLFVVDQEVCG